MYAKVLIYVDYDEDDDNDDNDNDDNDDNDKYSPDCLRRAPT